METENPSTRHETRERKRSAAPESLTGSSPESSAEEHTERSTTPERAITSARSFKELFAAIDEHIDSLEYNGERWTAGELTAQINNVGIGHQEEITNAVQNEDEQRIDQLMAPIPDVYGIRTKAERLFRRGVRVRMERARRREEVMNASSFKELRTQLVSFTREGHTDEVIIRENGKPYTPAEIMNQIREVGEEEDKVFDAIERGELEESGLLEEIPETYGIRDRVSQLFKRGYYNRRTVAHNSDTGTRPSFLGRLKKWFPRFIRR